MLLMIDNYDSFTYNLVQYLGEMGVETSVVRHDKISVDQIKQLAPSHIIISPGPCTPDEAGVSLELIETFAGQIPILGVCLGHQCIAQVFGGKVVHANRVMHGKTSVIHHNQSGLFAGIKQAFTACRYHSLVVDVGSLPDCFEITAWTEDENGGVDEIMGIKHLDYDLQGVQFHPEAILSECGRDLLRSFVRR